MNTGDSTEFSEENYSTDQDQNQIEESPSTESEKVEYEYVDEEGNPVSENELEGYEEEVSEEVEYVDEEGNPVSENEIETEEPEYESEEPVQEIVEPTPEPSVEETIQQPEQSFSQEETNIIQAEQPTIEEPVQEIVEPTPEPSVEENNEEEEILQDIHDISGMPMDQLKSNIIQSEPVQEIVEPTPEPIIEETIQQPEQSFSQEETNIIQSEPVQEIVEPTPQPEVEEPIQEVQAKELDVEHFINNAQKSQEIIEQQPEQEPPRVVSTLTTPQQPEQPTIQEAVEPVKTEKELDVEHFINNAQKSQEEITEPVQEEPDQIKKPEDTEELLQRLTMGKQNSSEVAPVQDTSEDTKENPYIYRQGHPHLDSHIDLDKIKKITEKLFFSSDEGANKMKEHKKKTKFSL